jgi:REP element-mobilizing transposase RayT
MSQPKTKIWIHAILSTKDRLPLIHPDFENKVYDFIKDELTNLGCTVELINGSAEHIHVIFLLNPQKSLTDIILEILNTSSETINKNFFTSGSFAWQTDFAAYSVSESQLTKLTEYIKNQKEHHKKQTFMQEYSEFLRLHGLS